MQAAHQQPLSRFPEHGNRNEYEYMSVETFAAKETQKPRRWTWVERLARRLHSTGTVSKRRAVDRGGTLAARTGVYFPVFVERSTCCQDVDDASDESADDKTVNGNALAFPNAVLFIGISCVAIY
jgi:hypothetical protein